MKPAKVLKSPPPTTAGGEGQESPLMKTFVRARGFPCLAAVPAKLALVQGAAGCCPALQGPSASHSPRKGPLPGPCLQLVGFMGMHIMCMAIEMPLLL